MKRISFLLFLLTGLAAHAQPAVKDTIANLGWVSLSWDAFGGAVETVSGSSLQRHPSYQLTEVLTGQLPSLSSWQTSSGMGDASFSLYSRGVATLNHTRPLVVVDGLIVTDENIDPVSSFEISRVTLLKDAAGQALYGVQGANGVLIVETCGGRTGRLSVSAKADYGLAQVSRLPFRADASSYARLRNEAWRNDGAVGVQPFSEAQLALIGRDPHYPDNDWYRYYLRDLAHNARVGVNVSGGSERATYFSNVNLIAQGPLFRTAGGEYDAAPRKFRVNFRTKADIRLSRHLSVFVRIAGHLHRDIYAGGSDTDATLYSSIFSLPPTLEGPLDADGHILTTLRESNPVYGRLNASGYTRNIAMGTTTHAGARYKLGTAAGDFSLGAAIAFQTASDRMEHALQSYERWSFDTATGEYVKTGSQINTLLERSVSGTYQYQIDYVADLSWDFHRGAHAARAKIFSDYNRGIRSYSNPDIPATGMEYIRHNTGLWISYDLLNRYFIQGTAALSGSDAFAREHRYAFVPAVSAAWVVSREQFLQGAASWLDLLKIRASCGQTANDRVSSTDYRFLYLDYIIPRGTRYVTGNPDLEAEKIHSWNVGLDAELLGGLRWNLDVFGQRTDNMFIDPSRQIPVYQGLALRSYAPSNSGVMENRGFELRLGYDRAFGKDWRVGADLSYAMARNRILSCGEMPYPTGPGQYAYAYRQTGYPAGQSFGLLIDRSRNGGYISDETTLAACKTMYEAGGIGTPRMGDFIYLDLNEDGKIDRRDYAPIGSGTVPSSQWLAQLRAGWRSLSLSVSFQGVSGVWGDVNYATEKSGYGIMNDLHARAWTAQRQDMALYPALAYAADSPSMQPNDFLLEDRSFVRLRNISILWSLPRRWFDKIRLGDVCLGLNVQNVACWDSLTSKYIDPEAGSMTVLPPLRMYDLSLKVEF